MHVSFSLLAHDSGEISRHADKLSHALGVSVSVRAATYPYGMMWHLRCDLLGSCYAPDRTTVQIVRHPKISSPLLWYVGLPSYTPPLTAPSTALPNCPFGEPEPTNQASTWPWPSAHTSNDAHDAHHAKCMPKYKHPLPSVRMRRCKLPSAAFPRILHICIYTLHGCALEASDP